MMRGEVAIAGRLGRERLWDLPERVYPADVVVPSVDEAERVRNERRLASLGIARQKTTPCRSSRSTSARPASRPWSRARRASGASTPPRSARTSKGGRRCCRRSTGSSTTASRAQELFDFEYTLEMYKPAAKRRWGYFALPILHGDRLVGKVDAVADRKASVLRVQRDPRGREVHPCADQVRARRARGPGRLARARTRSRADDGRDHRLSSRWPGIRGLRLSEVRPQPPREDPSHPASRLPSRS